MEFTAKCESPVYSNFRKYYGKEDDNIKIQMKITKYYQSCLMIEEGNARIMIDPSGHESQRISEFGALDAVFYTHEHADHFDAALAAQFQEHGVMIYANESVARQMDIPPIIARDGQELTVRDIHVKVHELPHCLMPDGNEGPQNTGYLINQRLFHPGDGKEQDGLEADILALPIAGPDISMKDAYAFARQVGAKTAIAIHWHTFGANVELYNNFTRVFNQPFELKILDIGGSMEL